MTVASDVTIVGAGPYGLSIAAHLHGSASRFRIFGHAMETWRTNMPQGMHLKSPGFASTLYDPGGTFTLAQYCREKGIPYKDVDWPIPLDTFCDYGMAFQERFAPNLENEKLVSINRCENGFRLFLENGTSFHSAKVVIAVGIDYFRHIPGVLASLPRTLVSHSADQRDVSLMRGKRVAVIGAGASAIDLAVLLHEAGAHVQLISRRSTIEFGEPWGGASRPLLRRLRAPISGIGPGWRSRLCADLPGLYRYLPDTMRVETALRHLRPAPGWFMKDRAAGIPVLSGYEIEHADVAGESVHLHLAGADGNRQHVRVDHVIAATGYRSDVQRLPFLRDDIGTSLNVIEGTPRLSANFESSVPGLYFAGPISATTFGPVMRFACGAGFTATKIARHITRATLSARRNAAQQAQPYSG